MKPAKPGNSGQNQIVRNTLNSPSSFMKQVNKKPPSGGYFSPGNFDNSSDEVMSPNRLDIAKMGKASNSFMQKPNLQERNYALKKKNEEILPIGAIRGKDYQQKSFVSMNSQQRHQLQ